MRYWILRLPTTICFIILIILLVVKTYYPPITMAEEVRHDELIHLETTKNPGCGRINMYKFKNMKGKKLIVINSYEGHLVAIIINETTQDFKMFNEGR